MEVEMTLKEVLPVREFTTEKGTFKVQPIIIGTEEKKMRYDGTSYTVKNEILCDVTGKYAEGFNVEAGRVIKTNLSFSLRRMPDGRVFQSINAGYISIVK